LVGGKGNYEEIDKKIEALKVEIKDTESLKSVKEYKKESLVLLLVLLLSE
jgi:phosphotransferase system IIB component